MCFLENMKIWLKSMLDNSSVWVICLFYILFILLHNIFPYKVLTYNIIFDDIIFYSITLYWSSLLDIVSKDKKTLKMICIQTGKEWFSVPTCLQASALEIRECRAAHTGLPKEGSSRSSEENSSWPSSGPLFSSSLKKDQRFSRPADPVGFLLEISQVFALGKVGDPGVEWGMRRITSYTYYNYGGWK